MADILGSLIKGIWSTQHKNGGIDPFNDDVSAGASDTLGRIWNNLSGTTANNQYNAEQADLARTWESQEAAIAREYNSAEAKADREWQEYMSNTAYQRAVGDMKSAGINPASLGGDGTMSPASTPGGASASSSAPHGSAASAAHGSGSVLSIASDVAKMVISRALFSKFTNSAQKAKSAPGAVKNVQRDALQAITASKSKPLRFRMPFEGSWIGNDYWSKKDIEDAMSYRWTQ